jgi:hypothetical protein
MQDRFAAAPVDARKPLLAAYGLVESRTRVAGPEQRLAQSQLCFDRGGPYG